MRKKLYLTISIILLLNLAGCGGSFKGAAAGGPSLPQSISFDDLDSMRSIRENNPLDSGFAGALSDFTNRTVSKPIQGKTGNLFYSPVSLYMALSLAGTGANGATREEIFSVLGLSGKGADYLSEQNGNLFRRLYSDNEIGKLKIANSLWLSKETGFKKAFTSNAVGSFYASLYNIDFSDKNSAKLMSGWISENTNGILTPEIKLDPEQIMSIINTVYFKDEWLDRFDEADTAPDVFHLGDGGTVRCDFMNMTLSGHQVVKGDGFTSSSLGLKNEGSMIFILPDKGVSIDELLSTPGKAALLFKEEPMKNEKVIFKIPRFSFGSDLNFKDTLKELGVVSAFDRDADFTGMTDHLAFISDIRQQTHIAIDEKGVEAGAFTQIQYYGAAQSDVVTEMILDRPFIFAVKSNLDGILFFGIVNNPTEK